MSGQTWRSDNTHPKPRRIGRQRVPIGPQAANGDSDVAMLEKERNLPAALQDY